MAAGVFAGGASRDADFPSTLWSDVVAAGAGSSRALEVLAQRYWKPAYAWLRRSGRNSQDAADLTQDFFVSLLEGTAIQRAEASKGRFRAYLKACLRNFLADEHDRRTALKRGGGRKILSLEVEGVERVIAADTGAPPDEIFERQWALVLLERALERLKSALNEQALQIFEESRAPESPSQAEIGRELGMTENAVAASLMRSRKKFRQILIEEARGTVAANGDAEAELQELLKSLGGGR